MSCASRLRLQAPTIEAALYQAVARADFMLLASGLMPPALSEAIAIRSAIPLNTRHVSPKAARRLQT